MYKRYEDLNETLDGQVGQIRLRDTKNGTQYCWMTWLTWYEREMISPFMTVTFTFIWPIGGVGGCAGKWPGWLKMLVCRADISFYSALINGCNYFSMMGLNLNHIIKRVPSRCNIASRFFYITNWYFEELSSNLPVVSITELRWW